MHGCALAWPCGKGASAVNVACPQRRPGKRTGSAPALGQWGRSV